MLHDPLIDVRNGVCDANVPGFSAPPLPTPTAFSSPAPACAATGSCPPICTVCSLADASPRCATGGLAKCASSAGSSFSVSNSMHVQTQETVPRNWAISSASRCVRAMFFRRAFFSLAAMGMFVCAGRHHAMAPHVMRARRTHPPSTRPCRMAFPCTRWVCRERMQRARAGGRETRRTSSCVPQSGSLVLLAREGAAGQFLTAVVPAWRRRRMLDPFSACHAPQDSRNQGHGPRRRETRRRAPTTPRERSSRLKREASRRGTRARGAGAEAVTHPWRTARRTQSGRSRRLAA
jgi:hypothetical protein